MTRVGVEDLGGGERRDLACPVHLATEATSKLQVIAEFRPDHLDGDHAAILVPPQIDGAHATLAEAREQFVPAEHGRLSWP